MAATVKVWSGSAWVTKPVKVWSGSAWVAKPLKYWNGSAWIGPASITAPSLRSQTLTPYTTQFGGLVMTKPAGVVADDIMLAFMVLAQGPAPANPGTPSGWTALGSWLSVATGGTTAKSRVFWKRATASEPADYTWTTTDNCNAQGLILAYSGCPTAGSPIDVSSVNSANSGTTATGTGVTTTQANDVLVWMGHNWDGTGTLTPPSGMTELADHITYSAHQTIAAAGATGNRTQTQASSSPWVANMIALKGK